MEKQQKSSEQSEGQSSENWVKPPGARGTAAMNPETRRRVASLGGQKVSRDRAHMVELGRKGGQSVSKNREHMSKIGRAGGSAKRVNKAGEA